MKYELINSTQLDLDRLINYKKKTIFEYTEVLSQEEIDNINNYVCNSVIKEINNYFNIVVDNKIVGCILMTNKDNGILLDEIYLDEEYRCRGIGSDIINNIKKHNNIIYLWVYKLNIKAISLYKKLGFSIINETETRYYMRYINTIK